MVACKKGWYGIDCNDTCGHCSNVSECFHINGTCPTGCDAGYQGHLCKSRTYMYLTGVYQKFQTVPRVLKILITDDLVKKLLLLLLLLLSILIE